MSRRHMDKELAARRERTWDVLLTLVFAAVGWLLFFEIGFKYFLLLAGAGIVALLWLGDVKRLGKLPALLLLGHAAFTMLTIFWALSGKFFLKRYAVLFIAVFFFLYAVLRGRGERRFAVRAVRICAGICTFYAVTSVAAISLGFCKALLESWVGTGRVEIKFAFRMYGVFGNCNLEAAFFGLGILLSVALLCASEEKRARILWAAALACNVYAMLLGVSLGAMASFALAAILYLAAAGKNRGAVLTRMAFGALCGGAGALLAVSLFSRFHQNSIVFLPLLLIVAALGAAAELLLGERAAACLDANRRNVNRALLGLAAIAALYVVTGLLVRVPYTLDYTAKQNRQITADLKPGMHTLRVDATTDMTIKVSYLDERGLGLQKWQPIGSASGNEYTFEVPENAANCRITLRGAEAGTVRSAKVDGRELLVKNSLFPQYIAGRLSNIKAYRSVAQRIDFARDGLKLFRRSPIVGLGSGAFENGVTSVQSYKYETKHTHNQYVETLLESGIVGFALFAGTLLAMAAALWTARKKSADGEFAWLYPALCGELLMSALQMAWDATMMVTAFVCMLYTLFGLIVSVYAEPLGKKAAAEEAPKKKKAQPQPAADPLLIRLACSVLPVLFVLSVCLNLRANRLTNRAVKSFDDFETAVRIDLYEYNDWKLSYVIGALSDETGEHLEQANAYAAQLAKVQSNSVPRYLTSYYLNTMQYGKAIDEAMLGATYSVSDPDTWNDTILSLKLILLDSGAMSPLLTQGDALLPKLMEYHAMLERYNATALAPIALTETSETFFDKVLRLNDCAPDSEAMLAILTEL